MIRLLFVVCLLLAGVATAQTVLTASVNEGTTAEWTITFRDPEGTPVAPETAAYRIATVGDASVHPVELVPSTQITPGTSVTVTSPPMTLPYPNNRNPNLPESRQCSMTVTFTWASGTKQGTSDAKFPLRNVPGWPDPTPTATP